MHKGPRGGEQAKCLCARDIARLMAEGPDLVAALHGSCDVALVRGFDAVKHHPVAPTANQTYVLGVRPAERHCGASGLTALETAVEQIVIIPELLGKHTAVVGHALEHIDV